jgi:hypothetical protein
LAVGSYAISTGKISILQNEDLRKNIQVLIPSVEKFLSSRSEMQKEVEEMTNDPTIRKYFRIRQARFPSGYGDAGTSKFPSSFLPLLHEPIFESYLEQLRLDNAAVIGYCIRAYFNLEQTIRYIKKDLIAFDIIMDQTVPEVEPLLFPFRDYDRPRFNYYASSNYRIPRWRDLSDSLLIEFHKGNEWGTWQVTQRAYSNGDPISSDYSEYSGVKLELKSRKGSNSLLFGLKDINDQDEESGHELELTLTEEWQTYIVPFDQYSDFDPSQFHYLKFIHLSSDSIDLLVKRIEFI